MRPRRTDTARERRKGGKAADPALGNIVARFQRGVNYFICTERDILITKARKSETRKRRMWIFRVSLFRAFVILLAANHRSPFRCCRRIAAWVSSISRRSFSRRRWWRRPKRAVAI